VYHKLIAKWESRVYPLIFYGKIYDIGFEIVKFDETKYKVYNASDKLKEVNL